MSLIAELKERQRLVTGQADNYLNDLEKSGRAFNPATDATWSGYQRDLDAIDQRLGELEGLESRNQRAGATRARYGSIGATRTSSTDSETGDAFRSAILEKNPMPITVSTAEPRSYYQPGVERRDLLKTAPASFQPVSFWDRIVETMVETSAVAKAGATVLTTDTGEDLRIPRSTANGTAGIVAEAAAIPESDPTLGVVTLSSFKYALLIQVSSEMAQDTSVDLQGYLAREAGTAIGVALGNHLINGTGTGQPRGVLADATVGVTGPTGTATSFGSQATAGQGTDLLNSLYGSLAEPYVATGSTAYLARNATITSARNLKANTGELVGSSYISNAPAPFYVDPAVPALAANAKSVLFGDWSRYFLRLVNGIRFERSDEFAFANDLVTFRVLLRADGALIDPSAIKYFQNSAT
jgi:HK97 family phage major capsid protein